VLPGCRRGRESSCPCVPAALAEVTGWQRAARHQASAVRPRLIPLKGAGPRVLPRGRWWRGPRWVRMASETAGRRGHEWSRPASRNRRSQALPPSTPARRGTRRWVRTSRLPSEDSAVLCRTFLAYSGLPPSLGWLALACEIAASPRAARVAGAAAYGPGLGDQADDHDGVALTNTGSSILHHHPSDRKAIEKC